MAVPSTWAAAPPPAEPQTWAVPAPRPSVIDQNKTTFTVFGVVLAYIVLASVTGIVLLGIAPLMMSTRAVRRKEPLRALAVVAAAGALLLALTGIA
jgi:hypothetical protein